ncbi:hypothetical protein CAPTEDRAFT_214047 [Capitella teleta]|uniref:Uncharacterized protein n=1 Tax=Capitella teleta TaxID=283909 RepID=R7TSS3_CAPTE|nr:hypothetical protein CAPTEDRAFT_214047 [Capitella teleta]|eukprot:ELT94075.1 hypothetical protein CAPTEDRAFT_214047 [Capitella teleta]
MATDKDYIQIAKEPYSSSEYDSSNDDETSMSTSSSSSKSWEILSGPEPDLEGSIDVEALAAAAADEEPEAGSLVGSVSREAKQVLEGLRLEMRELSGGCSVIASGVDKVTTAAAEDNISGVVMISADIEVAVDFVDFKSNTDLTAADYYSRFLIIVLQGLQQQCNSQSPEPDNRPQLTSRDFKTFSQQFGFEHVVKVIKSCAMV